MNQLPLTRLALAFAAASLLLLALAYYWLSNAVHEIVGTSFFLLLIAHNFVNRRWWGGLLRQRRYPRFGIAIVMNVSLLFTMLTLLATSVIISQTVFDFLPIKSDFTSRQIHAAAAYWAIVIAGIHIGWQWHKVSAIVSGKLGLAKKNAVRSALLHGSAIVVAAYGVHSSFEIGLGSKLFMQMTLNLWDFERSTAKFFACHASIIVMFAFSANIFSKWREAGKSRAQHELHS